MELEDLKQAWHSLDEEDAATPSLSPSAIKTIMTTKYRHNLRRILLPEVLFTALYLYFIMFLAGFHEMLDSRFLRLLGGTTMLLLLVFPILRFAFLRQLYRLSNPALPYAASLRTFARQKLHFLLLQRARAGVGFLIVLALSVLTTKIYGEYDVTTSKYFWAILFTVGFFSVYVINKLLLRRYQKAITSAEQLLKDLNHA